ncbi:2-oxoglutarate synthase [Desulfurobacterium thermolithotrophum DSM 11699]|uniref:2-oxoglutarate synthase n=1 Tax=Desulfurobacterium thermolithotrophum (strain DSM 11699 / BSA) TaxID=868864 RepID=F0S194_DESTD|nr:2-oxoacid:ferredoxin oxidoreductase subunit beta [Desulfurobacterium thermolithotrophum]ADY72825.1 2-oxoglutarate synthase [Desulfurobacterium thermolithotrophum DSM 11699]
MNIPMEKIVEKKPYFKYLRLNKMPTIWCPGCGIGQAFRATCMALHELGIPNDKVAMVSGIGCSSRTPGYFDGFTLHTTHGRALTAATGLKLYKPELTTIVFSGDGDSLAIGGNHFIHAARRNIDITLVLINNWIYGMTGGQVSPTTPKGSYATTTPYGNYEPNFDIAKMAIAAGATYVARGTAYHATELAKLIADGIKHKGFSLIEVLSPCTIIYGRKNRMSIEEMYFWFKENTLPVKAWEKLPEEKRAGKIPRGVLYHDTSRPEYTEVYWNQVKALSGGQK